MTEDFFAQHVLVHLPAHTQSLSGLEISELVMQLPSIIVILFMFSLFFSLLAEGRFMTWLNKPKINRESLKNFMVPDFVIWVFIGSLLAAFMQTEIKAVNVVGLNLLNIVLVTYFFQGLAVASAYFSFLKMSSLWKIIFYVILTTQLFLLVALVGVTDFWAGFRERLAKKATGIDKSSGPNKI